MSSAVESQPSRSVLQPTDGQLLCSRGKGKDRDYKEWGESFHLFLGVTTKKKPPILRTYVRLPPVLWCAADAAAAATLHLIYCRLHLGSLYLARLPLVPPTSPPRYFLPPHVLSPSYTPCHQKPACWVLRSL